MTIRTDLFHERFKEYEEAVARIDNIMQWDARGRLLMRDLREARDKLLEAHRHMIMAEVRMVMK